MRNVRFGPPFSALLIKKDEGGVLYAGEETPSFRVDTLNPNTGVATTGPIVTGASGGVFGGLAPYPLPTGCTPPPPGMVSWWPGDGNTDDIQGGHNGTIQGGATFAPGLVNQAFSFSAPNDGVTVPDLPALAITQDLTLDAWINVIAFPRFMEIVMRGDSRQFLDPYYLAAHDGLVRFHIENASGNVVELEAPINAGEWVHVAGTLENATGAMNLYINGVLVNQTTTTIRPFANLDPNSDPGIGIGNLQGANGQGFDGLIDEVEIFNRALSQAEIQAIVDAGSFGKCKGQPSHTPTPTATPTATPRGGRATPTPRPRPTPAPRPDTQAFIPARWPNWSSPAPRSLVGQLPR